MPTLTATEARSKLYRLIDEAASSHEPIVIKGLYNRLTLGAIFQNVVPHGFFRLCNVLII